MSIHKLTAGSGYDYLTRQVAAMDATDKGHVGLASYYTEKGETPGEWIGAGLVGIDGLVAGDVVTADHMQSLFGSGHHPLATQRVKELDLRIGRAGVEQPTEADYREATRLGSPFKVHTDNTSSFRVVVAKAFGEHNRAAGLPGDWPVPAEDRARIRTEVGRQFFRAEHGRDPVDARELAASIAKNSRSATTAVAGYDLTFSPVKSVSTLWAVAEPATAAAIERAHQSAVREALEFLEQRALFTREGANGARQVNVRGLVAAAFTHRDSRAGDPDLHTHVAVSNKVQTLAGKWLAIDGRVMFKATVAASETYNTALERNLVDALGVRFADRSGGAKDKRPVREIVGVDPRLNTQFSKRRASVEARRAELVVAFQRTHGRPPTPIETLQLAQQATLETREAKHEPRSLGEQRATWHQEAETVLGSSASIKAMVAGSLHQGPSHQPCQSPGWFTEAAHRVVEAMEGKRATWQFWHVHAEAQRQVRAGGVATSQAQTTVDELVRVVLDSSVNLARPVDHLTVPDAQRRVDGSSVYSVAGANLFTSAAVVAAEERLVMAAGRRDGHAASEASVGVALLESTANGITLNPGQASLVREMATSGARVQLAIAPAGSGKTTAMRALTTAWTDSGGSIVGLAPSAAAAEALRSQIDQSTDTLAKLVWSISSGEEPDWVRNIGPSTLVILDEAGLASTLDLDAAVQFVLGRGGSVRLIGDDQQLAAIGAGGVLRDIRTQHGALHLNELVRFRDPAEGAASLALREGHAEALGFYLDRGRVHVGDQATMTEDLFAAWQSDRGRELDSIMLAPTRDLVGELNRKAREHRLEGGTAPETTLRLADDNEASVGDVVLTRRNDRRLKVSATDWVKNGDRWTVREVNPNGSLTVQHNRHGRTVTLPSDYVKVDVELGYACTVHTAQGVTTDTMHGLATGEESRQQLYTMLTRGALGNHVYLETVGDGDPHSVIHPTLVRPQTAVDVLEAVVARDESPKSATTQLREETDPARRLGHLTQRYVDSLFQAAEQFVGAHITHDMETVAETLLPGITEELAWPALRAQLLLRGAGGENPVELLRSTATIGELSTALDRAAVLDWRLDESGRRGTSTGPLEWLPAVPAALASDPVWGDYLTQRAHLVAETAAEVHARALTTLSTPMWERNGTTVARELGAEVEVWRAAMQVDADDRRPTGPRQLQKVAATYQRRLTRRVVGDHSPAIKEWRHLLEDQVPGFSRDTFSSALAERLAAMSRMGMVPRRLVDEALAAGPLPDEHAAAALWWRMARHLTPAVAEQIDTSATAPTASQWIDAVSHVVGSARAESLRESVWWPALEANLDHGVRRGWHVADLLGAAATQVPVDVDHCQSLVWRTSLALDPIPADQVAEPAPDEGAPADLWVGYEPPECAFVDVDEAPVPALVDTVPGETDHEQVLFLAGLSRAFLPELEPTSAELRRAYEWETQINQSPVPVARLAEVNAATQDFFELHYNGSWGQQHLVDRLGTDLTSDDLFRPGQAPAGWNHLVQHLRGLGFTDTEMLTAGVAGRASTGRLIDRFRDRLTFPIMRDDTVLGFVGRRHPDLTDADKTGPKYLNTSDTPLFHKGAQFFGPVDALTRQGATPVVVEGPIDAAAVTVASGGRFVGAATLGTALTEEQAARLARQNRTTVLATDPDLAGQVAAHRAYWMLAPHGIVTTHADLPEGLDPADLLQNRGAHTLVSILDASTPMWRSVINEQLANLAPDLALPAALRTLAAAPSQAWDDGTNLVARRLSLPTDLVRGSLSAAVRSHDLDPRASVRPAIEEMGALKDRLATLEALAPAQRWAPLATTIDARLVEQPDWPATAALIQQAHEAGHDVATEIPKLVTHEQLDDRPATDLRYRLVARLDVSSAAHAPAPGKDSPDLLRPEDRVSKAVRYPTQPRR